MAHFQNPGESATAAAYSHHAITHIYESRQFGAAAYAPISLSNDDANLIDPWEYPGEHDITTTHATLYWGDAGHPHNLGLACETRPVEDAPDPEPMDEATLEEEVRFAQRLILGAHIGTAALARTPQDRTAAARTIAGLVRGVSGSEMEAWAMLCAQEGAPQSLVQIGKITRSNRGLAGSRLALLWHPPSINPTKILAKTQDAIKRSGGGGAALLIGSEN